MEMSTFDYFKGTVIERIIVIPKGSFIPRFRDTSLREELVTFICNDEALGKWLAVHLETNFSRR